MTCLPELSIIIPAYNEADTLETTLSALGQAASRYAHEIVVVDDGSGDETAEVALHQAVRLCQHSQNQGKAAALKTGTCASSGDILLFVDADLGRTAGSMLELVEPVKTGEADMAIAAAADPQGEGLGLVEFLARSAIKVLCGMELTSPLCGQRCLRRAVAADPVMFASSGYGIEVWLTIQAWRRGWRIVEVPLSFSHRSRGRTPLGFYHRARQGVAVVAALQRAVMFR